MSEVAKAIRFLQEQTGCRVVLESVMAAKPVENGVLKPQESVSKKFKATSATPAKGAENALKSVSEATEKPAKRTRKVTKPIKEKAATFMTVAKFAELKGCRAVTVYGAIKDGRIPEAMINNTSDCILINSRCEWTPAENKATKVFCKETKMTFDSVLQATKATGLSYDAIMRSVKKGITTHKGLTFTRV